MVKILGSPGCSQNFFQSIFLNYQQDFPACVDQAVLSGQYSMVVKADIDNLTSQIFHYVLPAAICYDAIRCIPTEPGNENNP